MCWGGWGWGAVFGWLGFYTALPYLFFSRLDILQIWRFTNSTGCVTIRRQSNSVLKRHLIVYSLVPSCALYSPTELTNPGSFRATHGHRTDPELLPSSDSIPSYLFSPCSFSEFGGDKGIICKLETCILLGSQIYTGRYK